MPCQFDEASQQLPSRSYPPTLVRSPPPRQIIHTASRQREADVGVGAQQEEGDSPAAFNVLGDPLASQASFPFSQLPDVSFQVDEDNAEGGAAGADEASKLPDFLTDLLDEKDSDGRADSKGAGKRAPLMYQLVSVSQTGVVMTRFMVSSPSRFRTQSQTDYLQGSPSVEEAQRKKSPTKSKRTRD